MNKVVELLERHVQWLAIALGALFLGWMAWSYVVTPPVQAKIGSETVGPGEVDRRIANGPVADLENKMKFGRAPVIAMPTWVQQFVDSMAYKHVKQPVTLDSALFPFDSRYQGNPDKGGSKSPGATPGAAPVIATRLPNLPPAMPQDAMAGASNVRPPQAIAAKPADHDPAVAANNGGGNGAPANGGAPAAVVPVNNVPGVDKNWVCVPFTISNRDLAQEFGNMKLAALLYRTAFVRVQLIREEQLPDGKFGKETMIKELAFLNLKPMPAAAAAENDQRNYYRWATENQPDILQPRFYEVLRGDKWTPPGLVAPPPEVQQPLGLPDFDPNRDYSPEEQKLMTPEQRRAYNKVQEKKRDDERKAKAAENRAKRPKSGPKGGGGPRSGGSSGVANDAERPPRDGEDPREDDRGAQQPPPGAPRAGVPLPPGVPAGAIPAVPAAPAASANCPNGEWDPTAAPDVWLGWAFDDTAESAKTYRYKVIYSIKNPLFSQAKFANPQSLAKTFAVWSDKEKTEWSKPVKIPSRTSFYVNTNPQPTSPTVRFEVFAWQGGAKRSKVFEVGPGDMIGAQDGEVDYSTGWTLVDLRVDPKDPSRMFALISDPYGTLTHRDYFTDKDKPELQADRRDVQNGANANANAGTGNGG